MSAEVNVPPLPISPLNTMKTYSPVPPARGSQNELPPGCHPASPSSRYRAETASDSLRIQSPPRCNCHLPQYSGRSTLRVRCHSRPYHPYSLRRTQTMSILHPPSCTSAQLTKCQCGTGCELPIRRETTTAGHSRRRVEAPIRRRPPSSGSSSPARPRTASAREMTRGPLMPLSVVLAPRAALLPLQRHALRALRTLLLQNGTGHLSLAVELELEDGPARVLEARLRARVERRPPDWCPASRTASSPSRRKVAVNPDAALYSPT